MFFGEWGDKKKAQSIHSGIPIKTTLEPAETVQHAALITHFTSKAKSVIKQLDKSNELTFLRVRSKNHEIMIAPDKDYILVVLQNPA